MAAIAGVRGPAQPVGRRVSIEAYDGSGGAAGAVIEVRVNGHDAGHLDLGSGASNPISIAVNDEGALIELSARFGNERQRAELPPGLNQVVFRFHSVVLHLAGRAPVAHCPDGTSGSPCVTCRDARTGDTWTMCC